MTRVDDGHGRITAAVAIPVAIGIGSLALFARGWIGFPDGYMSAYDRFLRVAYLVVAVASFAAPVMFAWAAIRACGATTWRAIAIYVALLVLTLAGALTAGQALDSGQGG
jgi:hypothetical protein